MHTGETILTKIKNESFTPQFHTYEWLYPYNKCTSTYRQISKNRKQGHNRLQKSKEAQTFVSVFSHIHIRYRRLKLRASYKTYSKTKNKSKPENAFSKQLYLVEQMKYKSRYSWTVNII